MVTQTKNNRFSISMKPELKAFVEEIAKEQNTNRSKVISAWAEKHRIELMKEGYQIMAKEHSKFAETAINLASEVLPAKE